MNEKIEHIASGYVYTNKGNRYNVKQLKGHPRVGLEIDKDFNVVNTGSVDIDCINGVCDYQPPQAN